MIARYHSSNSSTVWGSGGAWCRVFSGLAGLFWLVAAHGAETNAIHEIAIRPIEAMDAAKVSYYRDIKPLLANHCVECHGVTEPEGEYQVGTVAELLKSGKKHGAAVIPGKPDESPVVRYIRGELKPQMPKGNPPMSVEGLHLLRQWIAAGAKDDTSEALTLAKNEKAAWEQFDPHQHRTVAKARLTPVEMDALLNDEADAERRFLARRAWRLTQLPAAPIAPPVKGPVFNAVDKFITAKWEANGMAQTPELCSDEAFVRRAFLDIIGVVPPALEAHQFLNDNRPDRRARLIDALLARSEDYADHWATFWEDIIASSDTNIRGGMLTRGNYRQWILNSLQRNKPYDLMVAELIDSTLPGARKVAEQRSFDDTFKVAYVRNDTPVVTMETAANVGQVFMGTSMKCATCHSHFENPEWPQARFIAFASIFAERDMELVRCEKRTGTFVAPAFPFEIPAAPKQMPVALEERMRRTAQLVTDPLNPRMAQTFVNRLWKRFVGLGLVEPVDEFRSDRQASHPELLAWLAQEFMRSGYDIKHVLRLVMNSRTYQLAYNKGLADAFDPNQSEAPRYFRSPQLRRLSAEQLLDSLQVVGTQKINSARRLMYRREATVLSQVLGRPAARSEVITDRSEEMATIQFLEMLNGPEYQAHIYRAPLLDLLSAENNAKVAVESLYLAALNRPPSAAESQPLSLWLQPALQQTAGTKLPMDELVLFDDEVPSIFTTLNATNYAPWSWGSKGEQPVFAGKLSIRTNNKDKGKVQWQGVEFPSDLVTVNMNESAFLMVYVDPKNPPTSLWLRIQQGDVDHQVVWTSVPVTKPADPLLIMVYGGELPPAGGWVKLEIPFTKLQLLNGPIRTLSFGSLGGTAYWDKLGLVRSGRSPRVQPLGDILWALETGPEFQFIR